MSLPVQYDLSDQSKKWNVLKTSTYLQMDPFQFIPTNTPDVAPTVKVLPGSKRRGSIDDRYERQEEPVSSKRYFQYICLVFALNSCMFCYM